MATTAGFKQQCPSCEAMVPIRDANLIGRKIDCPKCKYRFVVEDPGDDVDDDQEEAPKSRTRDERTNGKSAAKPTRVLTREEAEEEEAEAARSKKGASTKLILGIGGGVFGIVLLVIFSGDSSTQTPKQGTSPGVAKAPPVAPVAKDAGTKNNDSSTSAAA